MSKKENIINILEAFGGGLGHQDIDITDNYYQIMYNNLDTLEEKKALMFGALAVASIVGKLRVRQIYYKLRFRRALKNLGDVE